MAYVLVVTVWIVAPLDPVVVGWALPTAHECHELRQQMTAILEGFDEPFNARCIVVSKGEG